MRTFFGDAERDQSAERLLDLGQPRVLVPMFFTVTFFNRRLNCFTLPKLMLAGVTLTCGLVTVSVTGQKRAFLERSQQVVF